jgi:hypothetical protein
MASLGARSKLSTTHYALRTELDDQEAMGRDAQSVYACARCLGHRLHQLPDAALPYVRITVGSAADVDVDDATCELVKNQGRRAMRLPPARLGWRGGGE